MTAMLQRLNTEPLDPAKANPNLPKNVHVLLRKLIARRADDRWKSMESLADEFRGHSRSNGLTSAELVAIHDGEHRLGVDDPSIVDHLHRLGPLDDERLKVLIGLVLGWSGREILAEIECHPLGEHARRDETTRSALVILPVRGSLFPRSASRGAVESAVSLGSIVPAGNFDQRLTD